jgi:hypothetical protein
MSRNLVSQASDRGEEEPEKLNASLLVTVISGEDQHCAIALRFLSLAADSSSSATEFHLRSEDFS